MNYFKAATLLLLLGASEAFVPQSPSPKTFVTVEAYRPTRASWKSGADYGPSSRSSYGSVPSYGPSIPSSSGGSTKSSYAPTNASWKTGSSAPVPQSNAPAPTGPPSSGGDWNKLASEWANMNRDDAAPARPSAAAAPRPAAPAAPKQSYSNSMANLAAEWAKVNADKDTAAKPTPSMSAPRAPASGGGSMSDLAAQWSNLNKLQQ